MEWTPLLAVIVGSTGIVGAVAAAVQLSRRARLVRSIKAATKAAESVAESSQTRAVLQQAIEMDTLRLAAGSIITYPTRLLILHLGFVVAPIAAFAVSWIGASVGLLRTKAPYVIDPAIGEWTGIIISGVWVLAMGALMGQAAAVYQLREDWVASAILGQRPPVRPAQLRHAAASWQRTHGDAIKRQQKVEASIAPGGATSDEDSVRAEEV